MSKAPRLQRREDGSEDPSRDRRGLGRLALLIAAASVPVYPAIAIAAAAAYTVHLFWSRRARIKAPTGIRYVWGLALLGCLAQVLSHTVLEPPRPLESGLSHPNGIDQYEAGNLIANTDLSGARGWSEGSGVGAYVRAVAPGVWRLTAPEGERFTEVRNYREVRVPSGVPLFGSVIVRHDGTDFSGRLIFRTREGWQPAETRSEELAPGVVLLEGVMRELAAESRLRTFHLADLDGDWSYIDISLASLRVGGFGQPESFRPHYALSTMPEGIAWWLGGALILTVMGVAIRSSHPSGVRTMMSLGLLCGSGLQLAIVVSQLLTGQGGRPTGTLGDPNLLAHAAVMAGLASVGLAKRPLRMAGPAFVVTALLVLLSRSDAGLLGLVAGIFLFASVFLKRYRLMVAGFAVLVVIVGGGRLLESLPSDSNNVARLQAWESVLEFTVKHPVAGLGVGNFAHHHEFATPREPGRRFRNGHAHTLLGVGADSGLPVFLLLLVGLGVLLVGYVRARCLLLAAVLTVAILLNLVDLTLFIPAVMLPWWAMHSLGVKPAEKVERSSAF